MNNPVISGSVQSPQSIVAEIVKKQVRHRQAQAQQLLNEGEKMATCNHDQQKKEVKSTFTPKSLYRCSNCRAWLEE